MQGLSAQSNLLSRGIRDDITLLLTDLIGEYITAVIREHNLCHSYRNNIVLLIDG